MSRTSVGQHDDPSRPVEDRPGRSRAGRMARLFRGGGLWHGRRLLFLDDDPARAALFLADHPRAVWVTTVPECLAQLKRRWDEVHLDHDLGGKVYVDSSDTDCGMEVIRWLCAEPRPHLKSVHFFVHTHNATAGLLMVLMMQRGGYRAEFRPFGRDLKRILAHNEPGPSAGWRSKGRAALAAMAVLLRRILGTTTGTPPVEPQPALPGSSDEIQPPPSTKSP